MRRRCRVDNTRAYLTVGWSLEITRIINDKSQKLSVKTYFYTIISEIYDV